MSKIICDICGTRYPDTAEQCPICGHIREGEVKPAEDLFVMDEERTETYQKVRGGRFSKSNVKKRAGGALPYEEDLIQESRPAKKEKPAKEPKPTKKEAKEKHVPADEDIFVEDNQNKKTNAVLNILLVLVILALLGVTAYIFTQHVLPSMNKPEPTTAPTVVVTEPTEPVETEEPTYPCDELLLEEAEHLFTEYDEKWLINVDVRPANTTDQLSFASSDELIATVDSEGCVTAKAEGTCVITITCGNVKVEYNVICLFPGVEIFPGWEPTEAPPTEPPKEWKVTSNYVNIRSGPAKDYDRVRQVHKGDLVYVYEEKDVKGTPWGRLEDGWICLTYAKLVE